MFILLLKQKLNPLKLLIFSKSNIYFQQYNRLYKKIQSIEQNLISLLPIKQIRDNCDKYLAFQKYRNFVNS